MIQYSEEEVLEAIRLTQSWIDIFINEARAVFFPNLEDPETAKKFQIFNQLCKSSYDNMKLQFNETFRDEGERYFEHLREVARIIIEMDWSNTNQVIIALLHDAIEDIALFDFGTIHALTKDPKIAIAVEAISKKPWQEYLSENEDRSDKNKELGKVRRNKEYFGHIESIQSFEEHIKEIAESNDIHLDSTEITTIARNAIQVKFADRIHNLSTQWDPEKTDKVERKIEETEKYFYAIAKEFDTKYDTNVLKRLKTHVLALTMKLEKYPQRIEKVLKE